MQGSSSGPSKQLRNTCSSSLTSAEMLHMGGGMEQVTDLGRLVVL